MKILLIGSGAVTSIENMYLRAFQNFGVMDVVLYPVDAVTGQPQRIAERAVQRMVSFFENRNRSKNLLDYLKNKKNFFEWIIVFKGMSFTLKDLEQFKNAAGSAKWLNINPDDPFNTASRGASNSHVVKSMIFYDLYATWSLKILKKLKTTVCRKAVYLPFGYDETVHFLTPLPVEKKRHRILFIGTWDPEREQTLKCLADLELVIYGNGWQNLSRNSPLKSKVSGASIDGPRARQEVASSAVCLNLLRSQNDSAHNMRTFEIPAMGGMMLATRSQEQQDFFKEGLEAEYFSTIEELVSKIEYYSHNPDQALQVGEAGYQRVRASDYSYKDRVRQLMSLLT